MTERCLVVSLGSIGHRHLANLRQLRPKAEIAVLRTHSGSAEQASEGIPEGADHQFHSMSDALAFNPQLAVVSSPASLHLQYARSLAGAGVKMLIEKPISHSMTELKEFIDQIRLYRLPVAIGYNLRFLPSLGKVHSLVQEGAIGRILAARAEVGQYLPDWRKGSDYRKNVSAQAALGGGVLLELSHELDYLYWMFGMPNAVTACGGKFSDLEIDVEDIVELCLEYENPKRLVNVHLDFLQRSAHRSCRIIGSEGTIVWSAIEDTIDLFKTSTNEWKKLIFPLKDRNQMYLDEMEEFLSLPSKGKSKLSSAVEAFDVLAIVDAAKASIETGKTISVRCYDNT